VINPARRAEPRTKLKFMGGAGTNDRRGQDERKEKNSNTALTPP